MRARPSRLCAQERLDPEPCGLAPVSGPLRLHLLLLAGSVSAIKVVLFTCGTTVALARAGAESMPWFYLNRV